MPVRMAVERMRDTGELKYRRRALKVAKSTRSWDRLEEYNKAWGDIAWAFLTSKWAVGPRSRRSTLFKGHVSHMDENRAARDRAS